MGERRVSLPKDGANIKRSGSSNDSARTLQSGVTGGGRKKSWRRPIRSKVTPEQA